jgi:hypothetical protein
MLRLLLVLLLMPGWLDDWPSSPIGSHHQGAPTEHETNWKNAAAAANSDARLAG